MSNSNPYLLVKRNMEEQDIDALFVTRNTNVRFLSGFTGSDAFLFVTPESRFLITDSRYTEQATRECPDFEIVRWRNPAPALEITVNSLAERTGVKRLHFESDHLPYAQYEQMQKALSPSCTFLPISSVVEKARYVKTPREIDCLRRAAHIADMAFADILDIIHPGLTERDVERELAYHLRKRGASDIAFPLIVASGSNSSMPHAVPSDRMLETGDLLTLDFGAEVEGYRSDMTRTVVLGKATVRQRELYDLVHASLQAGLDALRSGVQGQTVDAASRNVIAAVMPGETFGYGVGHGIGLDIHEEPFMKPGCEQIIEEGCVVTVEPGVYLPGWGGIRIEESAVATTAGAEILTKSPRSLIELS